MYDPIRDEAAEKAAKSTPSTAGPSRNRQPAQGDRSLKRPAPDAENRLSSNTQKVKRTRSPTPPPRSPPRQQKRPGRASRVDAASKEMARQKQREREAREQKVAAERGSHDVVKQYYNSVPQRGRDWRRTESKIKGLRSFNNWVKSVLIQKFSPNEDFKPGSAREHGYSPQSRIFVLDIGCGKGGDIGKWRKAPQKVACYIGIDPAEVSIEQARERYEEAAKQASGRGRGGIFEAHFFAKDGYGEWVGDIPIVRDIGIDKDVGSGTTSRWGNAGFDVVTMMFCMHYAFETEEKARGMLRNVAGALKKGGKCIGVIPNSDVISSRVKAFHAKKQKDFEGKANGTKEEEDGEVEDSLLQWGNDLYNVRFPGETPEDGVFRPPFGWKYSYFIEEAVEAPEYVVPFEAFRALAEEYNLELQYRKSFHDVWKDERGDSELNELARTMRVPVNRDGEIDLSPEEWEAVGFYHAFCFYKV